MEAEDANQYKIALQPTDAEELVPVAEVAYYWDKKNYPDGQSFAEPMARAGKEAGISSPRVQRTAKHVREHLDRWRLYHFLLDHFQPEDVLVADRVDGGTRFTRLDPTKLESWLEDYSLGQLWEKNELGGRPGAE